MKKYIAIILAVLLLLPLPVKASDAVTVSMEYNATDLDTPLAENTQADAPIGTVLDINAKSAILIETVTGKVLYENNADEKRAPASITKIMGLCLVFEAIEGGALSLETKITASDHACSMGGSQIWLEPGEEMTVHELLKATVIASANDAMVALGEAVAGSEETFVAKMNEKAKTLGMNNTNFVNCTGLDAENHYTSAHDVAIMSAELVKYPLIKEYSTVWMDSLRDGKSELVNTNKLVKYYKGAYGLKTGTTSVAGSCLSAAAERDGLSLIAVVMGAPTSKDRFNGAVKLLDYGFANYEYKEISAEDIELPLITVRKGTKSSITPIANGKVSVLTKKGEDVKITKQPEITSELTAPVKAGDTVGYIHIYINSEEIGAINIKAAESSDKLTFWVCAKRILKNMFTL